MIDPTSASTTGLVSPGRGLPSGTGHGGAVLTVAGLAPTAAHDNHDTDTNAGDGDGTGDGGGGPLSFGQAGWWTVPWTCAHRWWSQLMAPSRQVAQIRAGYTAMTHAATAACTRLGASPDPTDRVLALLELQVAHEGAAALAGELPAAWIPGRDGLTLAQAHARTAALVAALATTEHRLAHPDQPAPRPDPHPGRAGAVAVAAILDQLGEVTDPDHRALLVLHLAILTHPHPHPHSDPTDTADTPGVGAGDGGQVGDLLLDLAAAYLHLGGGHHRPRDVAAWQRRSLAYQHHHRRNHRGNHP